MAAENLPRHVAVIIDGNGRWAERLGLNRLEGHAAGAKNVPVIVERLFGRGVETVTLYAFSAENFSRPQAEVSGILSRIEEFLKGFFSIFRDRVRLIISGETEGLGDSLQRLCKEVSGLSPENAPHTLNILLNYGGRAEIHRAARFVHGNFSEKSFRAGLYAPDLPDPDLIIRTGGERRLSGFMPYQSAYSELYFSDKMFPEFNAEDVDAALEDYSLRERRFGGIKHKVP